MEIKPEIFSLGQLQISTLMSSLNRSYSLEWSWSQMLKLDTSTSTPHQGFQHFQEIRKCDVSWLMEVWNNLLNERIKEWRIQTTGRSSFCWCEAVDVIMRLGDSIYGNVLDHEDALAEFYSAQQKDDESCSAWSFRLEKILNTAVRLGKVSTRSTNGMKQHLEDFCGNLNRQRRQPSDPVICCKCGQEEHIAVGCRVRVDHLNTGWSNLGDKDVTKDGKVPFTKN